MNDKILDQPEPTPIEARLLAACTNGAGTPKDTAAIAQLLNDGIDWTLFVQSAVDRGLATLAAHRLVQAAPDLVPVDILDALRKIVATAQSRNREVFDDVARLLEAKRAEDSDTAIEKARQAAHRALTANPSDALAWRTFGRALSGVNRREAAIACYNRAIELAPLDAITWADRAIAWFASGRPKVALSDVDKALALDPRNARAWTVRAFALFALKRYPEAAEAGDRALALDPENNSAARVGIEARLFACDWSKRDGDKQRITECVRAGDVLVPPLLHRFLCESEEEHLAAVRVRTKRLPPSQPLWRGETYHHDKIRVAFVSTDFRDHAVADSIVGCFEHHDRARFEVTAIAIGPDDGSPVRRRIQASVDRFVEAQTMSDAEVAATVRELEIDIAIDLNGYIGRPRTGILAFRPAPVQVNYLGYSGTMGASFIDYIIADRVVIPEENRIHYAEQVVYLPHSYLVTDNNRPIAENAPTRAEAGLPETGFVFTCHNTEHKFGPELFDIWMRLLRTVDGSVLWLKSPNPSAKDNLRRDAKARGVAPERLVFAARVPEMADHFARLGLADLFLDTLPYNAHGTACDALWSGLPLLTCPGKTFPSRVASSALRAIGLPELVAGSLAEYEQIALALAREPERLAAIKMKLRRARDTTPFFDTARFTRGLESALATMWERQQAGLPAAAFAVEAPP